MKELHREILLNYILRKGWKKDMKMLSTPYWNKIITQYFPITFGIEIEVPEICFSNFGRTDVTESLNKKLFNCSGDNKTIKHKKWCFNKNLNPNIFYNDVNSVELQSATKFSMLFLLENQLKVMNSDIGDRNFEPSLHIHLPLPAFEIAEETKKLERRKRIYTIEEEKWSMVLKTLGDFGKYFTCLTKRERITSSLYLICAYELQKHLSGINIPEEANVSIMLGRGNHVNMQPRFQTMEYRMMHLTNLLLMPHILAKVMLTRAMQKRIFNIINEEELKEILDLYLEIME